MKIFFMDTKRKTSEAWKEEISQQALATVEAWQPDVVIAADDNAQKYFVSHLKGRPVPQVVFCGVNAEPEEYGYPVSNVTGILERAPLQAGLALYQKVIPAAQKAIIISDDSPTSEKVLAYFKTLDTVFSDVAWSMPSTFEEWKATVLRVQDSVDVIGIYTYHTIKKDGQAESMDPSEVMRWTTAHSKVPILCMLSFAIDDGALFGVVESGVEQGYEAGLMARAMILDGKTAADFPIKVADKTSIMVNLDVAKRLGIHIPQDILDEAEIVVDTSGE